MIKLICICDYENMKKGDIYNVYASIWYDGNFDMYTPFEGFMEKNRFITLSEWREQRIDKILN